MTLPDGWVLAALGHGQKHDADCRRRKDESAELLYLCTCGLTDEQVAEATRRRSPHDDVEVDHDQP